MKNFMSIKLLKVIKTVEEKIHQMNSKTIASVREHIDNIEEIVGSIIADQLREKMWKQARFLELI